MKRKIYTLAEGKGVVSLLGELHQLEKGDQVQLGEYDEESDNFVCTRLSDDMQFLVQEVYVDKPVGRMFYECDIENRILVEDSN